MFYLLYQAMSHVLLAVVGYIMCFTSYHAMSSFTFCIMQCRVLLAVSCNVVFNLCIMQ